MNLSKILTNNGLGNIKISEIIANKESAKFTGLSRPSLSLLGSVV